MIRFCDSEVGCVEYELLSRSELLSYFLAGHLDEIVSVYDNSNTFMGIITYYSLLYSVSVDAAICRDYVILDDDIWQNAREIFKKKSCNVRDLTLLPVLDMNYQLICFAYQDEDANREIRMLRELQEIPGALQFVDVFPNYKCVKIHEFNELAYFFAEYLRNQKIMVQMDGAMWQCFFDCDECQVPDYECLNIYAEGIWEKTRNWKENLLRSVSAEFECVDKIYEANLKNGLIKDAIGDYGALLECLRGQKEIILCGSDMQAQDAYDFLIGNGIEICCFVVDELKVGNIHRLFGKRILGLSEAVSIYKTAVFIDCVSRHSAWGLGRVDYYDYIGYRRNERFFALGDYVEVPGNNLLNAFGDMEVVLTGDRYLCGRLYEYFKQNEIPVAGYLRTLQEDVQPASIPELGDSLNDNMVYLIVVPVYRSHTKAGYVGKEEKEQRIAYLRQRNIDNFTEYFCEMLPFINMEKNNNIKYEKFSLKPGRIVLGSIWYYNGNAFFRSLMDSHPAVLCIDYNDLNTLLFWICLRLSMERAENILPLFWELIKGNEEIISDRLRFDEKMLQLLAYDNRFTSQELFVMIHLAYMYMHGRDIPESNMENIVIYWEPHHMLRDQLEECVRWLETEETPCDIINVVRNVVPQMGSRLKDSGCISGGVKAAYSFALQHMPVVKKVFEQSDRMTVRFEDLKCDPKETLRKICDRWGIAWSDILMQTTNKGEVSSYTDKVHTVSGFDLGPVYNIYENFFSELDRLRLMIINATWQKKYGYSYVEPDQFTRRELQEMFLKEFRFENPGDSTEFYKGQLELDDRIELQNFIRRRIQETRCMLNMQDSIY